MQPFEFNLNQKAKVRILKILRKYLFLLIKNAHF